ncbi:hypothetical protein STSP1_02100 [Sedimentisphaera salicampi]|uniref:Uncharacterized protein n=1 Tax=Sedimentisphaera salicampi TaxID=1941349 RepID=A0A1W6LPH3_9BACT|nr:hypothetical protein STSP1_02100 [Sedimentisphaera salicampi]OXU14244.1 hypothetical protein SMSP1_02010 [Sedimentisphaera salicampi]
MKALARETLKVNKLKLRLYEKPLHPELFDVRRRIMEQSPACGIDLWITGCSHLISLHGHKFCVTEFLGTARQKQLPAGEIDSFRLKGTKYHSYSLAGGLVKYQTEFGIESVSENVYSYIADELKDSAANNGNLFMYTNSESGTLVRPFSYASIWKTADKVQLSVCHGYPAEMKVLRTLSLFEIQR